MDQPLLLSFHHDLQRRHVSGDTVRHDLHAVAQFHHVVGQALPAVTSADVAHVVEHSQAKG